MFTCSWGQADVINPSVRKTNAVSNVITAAIATLNIIAAGQAVIVKPEYLPISLKQTMLAIARLKLVDTHAWICSVLTDTFMGKQHSTFHMMGVRKLIKQREFTYIMGCRQRLQVVA